MGDTRALPATLEALMALDDWVVAWCVAHDVPARPAASVRLVLHELAANVVLHGGGASVLRATLAPGVMLVLEDDGVAFDPVAAVSAPVSGSIEDVAIGGLGLHLIQTQSRTLEYRREAGFNRVVATFGSD